MESELFKAMTETRAFCIYNILTKAIQSAIKTGDESEIDTGIELLREECKDFMRFIQKNKGESYEC